MAVQNSTGWQCFDGGNTDAARLGYRLGNPEDVLTLRLTPVTLPSQNPQLNASAANSGFDFAPPRSMLYTYANVPKPPAAANSSTANNIVPSTLLPPPSPQAIKPKGVQSPANCKR